MNARHRRTSSSRRAGAAIPGTTSGAETDTDGSAGIDAGGVNGGEIAGEVAIDEEGSGVVVSTGIATG